MVFKLNIQRYGYGGWIQLHHHCAGKAKMVKDGKLFREIEENCWSPEVRLKEMDAAGRIYKHDVSMVSVFVGSDKL